MCLQKERLQTIVSVVAVNPLYRRQAKDDIKALAFVRQILYVVLTAEIHEAPKLLCVDFSVLLS